MRAWVVLLSTSHRCCDLTQRASVSTRKCADWVNLKFVYGMDSANYNIKCCLLGWNSPSLVFVAVRKQLCPKWFSFVQNDRTSRADLTKLSLTGTDWSVLHNSSLHRWLVELVHTRALMQLMCCCWEIAEWALSELPRAYALTWKTTSYLGKKLVPLRSRICKKSIWAILRVIIFLRIMRTLRIIFLWNWFDIIIFCLWSYKFRGKIICNVVIIRTKLFTYSIRKGTNYFQCTRLFF